MEQSAKSTSSLLASATENELFVSQILLDLRVLMSLSESLADFNWGRKRRRSCLDQAPPPIPAPSWPAASPEDRIGEATARNKAEDAAAQDEKKNGAAARTTGSPDTPLSFSPSESDEKPKHSSKKSSKKKPLDLQQSRKNYSDMIEGLTQRKVLLTREIENVRRYYNKLKAENSKLKAIKQEVFSQHYWIRSEPRCHRQLLNSDPTVQDRRYMSGQIAENGLGSINNGVPLGIDLNLPAEEAFGVEQYRPSGAMIDDKRARFAEARRKRIGIMKNKSSRSLV